MVRTKRYIKMPHTLKLVTVFLHMKASKSKFINNATISFISKMVYRK